MTEPTQGMQGTKGKVLLVDDDKFLLDMYCMKFSQSGYNVFGAPSVSAAIEAIRGGYVPDAIIFDIVMPEETGFSLLERLKEEQLVPGMLKVALTNQDDVEEKKRAQSLGADVYLLKATMIPSEVVAKVSDELSKRTK